MDSLTQIALGAAVGEATLGKKVGNQALLWGAVAGTIPDLDVLANPILSDLEGLKFHRSVSHSLLFCLLFAPILGYFISTLPVGQEARWRDWTKLSFLSLFTHPLLDSLTNWGTQLFWPFSSFRAALNTIFIIDLFYTIPLIIGCVAAGFFARSSRKRRLWNTAGLTISSAYLLLGFFTKAQAENSFHSALNQQNITYERLFTNPAPLTTVFWYGLAESDDGFWLGYSSLFDAPGTPVAFEFIPKNAHLLAGLAEKPEMRTMEWITEGLYALEREKAGIRLNDLRFGKFDIAFEGRGAPIFSYRMALEEEDPAQRVVQLPQPFANLNWPAVRRFFTRVGGTNPNHALSVGRLWTTARLVDNRQLAGSLLSDPARLTIDDSTFALARSQLAIFLDDARNQIQREKISRIDVTTAGDTSALVSWYYKDPSGSPSKRRELLQLKNKLISNLVIPDPVSLSHQKGGQSLQEGQ